MKYLLNAFSLNMLAMPEGSASVHVDSLTIDEVREEMSEGEICNAIGHADTDVVVRGLLGLDNLPAGVRATVVLTPDDCAVVAQYSGPRLPEGATSLPAGSKLTWAFVTVD